MDTKVINKSEVKKAIRMKGLFGNAAAAVAMGITGLNRMNRIYSKIAGYRGVEFADKLIEYLNVTCDYNPDELEYIPKEGPFIVVSNHPYGGIDGMLLLSRIGSVRPDFRILTNFLLSKIPSLKDHFFPVNPFTDRPGLKSSIGGLKMAREHIERGGGLGLFPAGEVSSNRNRERVVKDIAWQNSIVKLIRGAGVPVVPVYFHGQNSRVFHWLGKINPALRTIRLPHELVNKKNRTISLRIGRPIPPAELEEYTDLKELGEYLWNRTYALEANVIDEGTKSARKAGGYTVPLQPREDPEALAAEIGSIREQCLFEMDPYACYLAEEEMIPRLMREIGRAREETFRAVGEGTNRPVDIDEYDKYYKHLILWNKKDNKLAGAYRLGFGGEIMAGRGISGFYTHSLFHYKEPFGSVLERSIELGRSFVIPDYQKEPLPLMLLIKGLFYTVIRNKEVKYLIGPVSISAWYPLFYRSLMIYYLRRKHAETAWPGAVRPERPFTPNYDRVNAELLLANKIDSLEKFDRFLLRLSNNRYRLPTLLKKYLKINARILDYNVDPGFNYCVDGLILLDLKEVPKEEIDALSKEFDDKGAVYKRFEEA